MIWFLFPFQSEFNYFRTYRGLLYWVLKHSLQTLVLSVQTSLCEWFSGWKKYTDNKGCGLSHEHSQGWFFCFCNGCRPAEMPVQTVSHHYTGLSMNGSLSEKLTCKSLKTVAHFFVYSVLSLCQPVSAMAPFFVAVLLNMSIRC